VRRLAIRRVLVSERSEAAVKNQAGDYAEGAYCIEPICGDPFSHACNRSTGNRQKRNRYGLSGISDFARTNVFLGILTIRSSGPQLADGGNLLAADVMSVPITAKSPLSSSQISGQPTRAYVCAPFECGSWPSLRRNIHDT